MHASRSRLSLRALARRAPASSAAFASSASSALASSILSSPAAPRAQIGPSLLASDRGGPHPRPAPPDAPPDAPLLLLLLLPLLPLLLLLPEPDSLVPPPPPPISASTGCPFPCGKKERWRERVTQLGDTVSWREPRQCGGARGGGGRGGGVREIKKRGGQKSARGGGVL